MKNWKAILGVAVVFLLGMTAGAFLTGAAAARRLHRVLHGQPAFTAQQVTRRLTRQLRLDPTQRDQMLTLVQAAQVQITDARQQCVPHVLAALDDFDAKARLVLRPDQAEKFDKLVADRKAKWANYKGD
jgi:Spy/CpxP family protein refolding chaperone